MVEDRMKDWIGLQAHVAVTWTCSNTSLFASVVSITCFEPMLHLSGLILILPLLVRDGVSWNCRFLDDDKQRIPDIDFQPAWGTPQVSAQCTAGQA